jgi:SAM-dependent methyltransferase
MTEAPEKRDGVAAPGFEVLVRHYEACLDRHGATPLGVDWPGPRDLETRFSAMLALLDGLPGRPVLLDLGCGPGLLVDYLAAIGRLDSIDYRGIDLSPRMIEAAKARLPGIDFECRDIVADPLPEQSVDVVLMNGILTERRSLAKSRMAELAQALVAAAFRAARAAIAFNVMSVHVDWEREDLFHWPFDDVAAFLRRDVSRHYAFHADYGLHEYLVTVRRDPARPVPVDPVQWRLR